MHCASQGWRQYAVSKISVSEGGSCFDAGRRAVCCRGYRWWLPRGDLYVMGNSTNWPHGWWPCSHYSLYRISCPCRCSGCCHRCCGADRICRLPFSCVGTVTSCQSDCQSRHKRPLTAQWLPPGSVSREKYSVNASY